MKPSKFFFAIVLLIVAQYTLAQQKKPFFEIDLSKKVYATTGFGFSITNNNFKQVSKDGFATFTGFEIQNFNSIFYRVLYGLNIYPYNYTYTSNGYLIVNKGNRNLINLAADIGYRKRMNKHFLYGFFGAGLGQLSSPSFVVDTLSMQVNVEPKRKFHFILRVGLGYEYQISKKLNIFLEANNNYLFEKTIVNDINLNLLNLFLGIKTPINKQKKN